VCIIKWISTRTRYLSELLFENTERHANGREREEKRRYRSTTHCMDFTVLGMYCMNHQLPSTLLS
jgi:hypothetical protein